MVLQVLADSGEVHHDGDAQGLEDLGVTNTAELEDLRALDGAGGKYGLLPDVDGVRLPAMRELDAGRDSLVALLLRENARNVRLSQHSQVRAAERGVEVALHCSEACEFGAQSRLFWALTVAAVLRVPVLLSTLFGHLNVPESWSWY